jgi:ubiquinone/menaquinone biosynthesis C-methylase UbiE
MKNKKNINEKLTGKEREIIPNIAFRMMTGIMKTMDFLSNSSSKNFKTLALEKGQYVIDYGCGPARYIKNASNAVGEKGKVIAVDIHPLAIKNVNAKIKKFHLSNVEAVLADGYHTPIPYETADVIYALDMFHMIKQPTELLTELSHLLKKDGVIIIEDGHQPRLDTIKKIKESSVLKVVQENKYHVRCKKN